MIEANIILGKERRVLAAILVSGFVSTLGIGLFSFTIPLMSLDDKISGAWLGSAFAGYYLAKLLISPMSGMVADRFGPRLPLVLAASLGCLAPLAYFFHQGLEILYAIQFAMGLVSGLIKPVGMAVLGGNGPQKALSRWFALHALAFNVALFAGPILGGFLYLNRSMKLPLLALSICMGLAALIVLILLPGDVRTTKKDSPQPATRSTGTTDGLFLLLAICGRTIGIGLLIAFYPIVLTTTLAQNGLVIAMVYAIPGLATCIGLPVMARLYTKKPQFMTVVSGMLISTGALFALGACQELWQFALLGTIMGLGAAISIPSSMALASNLSQRQGMVFGAANFAAGIGFLLGPLLGGVAVQNLHSVTPALQLAAVIGALSCIPLLASALRDQFHWGKGLAWGSAIFCAVLVTVFATLHFRPQAGTSAEEELYHFTDIAMGTVVKLTLKAQSQKAADDAARKTIAAMRMLQQDFDFRNPDGSIGRINRGVGKRWVTPTPRTYALLQRTLAFSEESGGVFDPTIGALTTLPLYYALDEAIARSKKGLVDYRLVLLDKNNKRVRLKKEGMALDMGGIAKGTIIDIAVGLLQKHGIEAGIVEAGGDFYCFGDRDWTVGIRHPRADGVYKTVTVREKGVCGSGDYQQFVTTKDHGEPTLRHHIINPSDMESATASIGVTVIADSAEKADALSTTLFIMGPDKGLPFMHAHYPEASAIWFRPNLSVVVTDNFPQ